MGELTFFLGLQVKQKEDGIFISKDKYVAKILKKFRFSEVKTASTPMETQKPLLKDEDEEEVDVHIYRSMIGSLMYLTSSRPDIMFAVCACARYQVNPKVSHLYAVKRIFRYLKGQPKLSLWYPKDYSFDLMAYIDSDYARASLDIKSTTKGCQFFGCRLISWQCKKQTVVANSTTEAEQFWTTAKSKTVNEEVQIHALVDGMKVIITESSVRRDLQLADEDGQNQVHMGEGSAKPTDTQHTPTFDMPPSKPKKTQKPRQPKRKTTKVPQPSGYTDIAADEAVRKEGVTVWHQDTMRDTSAHTRYERVSKMSSDSLLAGVNTPRSDKDRLKHIKLMKICTTLQKKVLDLDDEQKRTKTAQQTKIDGLERRVKKLEKKHRSRTHKLKRLYKVGLTARVISFSDDEALDTEDTSKHRRIYGIDADEDNALVSTHDDVTHDDEGIEDVGEEEVVEVVTTAKMIVDAAQVTTAIADILVTTAETIVTTTPTITVESTKTNVEVTQDPKRKGVMIQDPEETTTINSFFTTTSGSERRTELVNESTKKDKTETVQESSSKRTRDDLEQERSKKQKMEDDNESEELKQCLEIIPDNGDDVTIDATPLSVKTPIVEEEDNF
nr:uncharacterized mitochondrial protein AtMg00810-like [Tanacetum cinerariifolium]